MNTTPKINTPVWVIRDGKLTKMWVELSNSYSMLLRTTRRFNGKTNYEVVYVSDLCDTIFTRYREAKLALKIKRINPKLSLNIIRQAIDTCCSHLSVKEESYET